jgi:hypothetical protein
MTSILIDAAVFGAGVALVGDCLFPVPPDTRALYGYIRLTFIMVGGFLIRLSF